MAASPSGGVKPFPIEGPMKSERYRLQGMTSEEREWRKQWLKDQCLTEREPMPVTGYYQERLNPIRRFYRWPLEKIFTALVPHLGYETASHARWWTGRIGLTVAAVYLTYYFFKYNTRDWTSKRGWIIRKSKTVVLPGDPEYPKVSTMTPSQYASEGFENSPI